MYEEKIVLCGANSYEEKYYLNPDFSGLPDDIKDELKIMCVLYVNDVGGVLTLVYEENGELCFEVTSRNLIRCLTRLEVSSRSKSFSGTNRICCSRFNYTIRCSSWERNCRRKICY